MKKYVSLVAALCLAAGVAGCSGDDPAPPAAAGGPAPTPAAATFDVTDEAGYWFDRGEKNKIAGTRSLAIIKPGEKVRFLQTKSENGPSGPNGPSRVESLHTVTSLIWPADATAAERIDQVTATGNKGMGGQGVLPVPNVYNGWVQKLPTEFKNQLTAAQANPVP
jgi:hypothetical protein